METRLTSCYMCGEEIAEETWTILWNGDLPLADENMFSVCSGCYKKIIKYVETEHKRARKDLACPLDRRDEGSPEFEIQSVEDLLRSSRP